MWKITHDCFFSWWSNNGKRKSSLFLSQMPKWKFRQMWTWARQIIKKGDVNSEDDKIDGSEYEENEILKSHFSPIWKKVRTLPCIHHLKPVNCCIFVKFWAMKPQQHLSHLCKVLSCETPTTSISDANNYTVLQGIKYIRVHHLEKVKEKKEPCPL